MDFFRLSNSRLLYATVYDSRFNAAPYMAVFEFHVYFMAWTQLGHFGLLSGRSLQYSDDSAHVVTYVGIIADGSSCSIFSSSRLNPLKEGRSVYVLLLFVSSELSGREFKAFRMLFSDSLISSYILRVHLFLSSRMPHLLVPQLDYLPLSQDVENWKGKNLPQLECVRSVFSL